MKITHDLSKLTKKCNGTFVGDQMIVVECEHEEAKCVCDKDTVCMYHGDLKRRIQFKVDEPTQPDWREQNRLDVEKERKLAIRQERKRIVRLVKKNITFASEGQNSSYSEGYNDCRKDILGLLEGIE